MGTRRGTLLLLASTALTGCGGAIYMPRPSPRIQAVPDGSSLALVKNGQRYTYNFLGGNVDEAVAGNPAAEEEARQFKNLSIGSFVCSTIGAAGAGVGAGLLVYAETRTPPDTGPLFAGSLTSLIAGLTLSLVGSILASNAHPHLWNAINIYNDSLPAYPAWQPQPAYGAYPGAPLAVPPPQGPVPQGVMPQGPVPFAAPPPAALPPPVSPPPVAPPPASPPPAALPDAR